jgi:fumarate hydratase class II
MPEFRIEHDSMGDVRVPVEALWGAQTQRAVENFPISGLRIEPRLVRALALIKAESARVNARLREVPSVTKRVGEAIAEAADALADGAADDHFPIDVFQTGSGTSSNMNANEVIARLASQNLGKPVHPNDQVNASQSSNDVFPSAVHIAVAEGIVSDLLPALTHLARVLRRKQREFADVVKSGRTHLMDATPVTLGQEFGGYAAQIADCAARLQETLPRLCSLPLGGTAVGTGINAPRRFATQVIARLAERTGLPLTEARDHFAAQGARDALVECSGQLRVLVVALVKIANDIRWMASGPRTGLAEIRLPDLQPGSSIMPGKVNPVLAEVVTQVGAQVLGNDTAVAFAGSQGNFELNVFVPVMARNLLESIRLLTNACRVFADRCVAGIEANVDRLREYAESSPAVGTSLNPSIGYEVAAEIIKESNATGRSIREIVKRRGLMTDAELDRALDILAMTRGGIVG